MIQGNFKKWNRITVMLSRDRRLPLVTWNTCGSQEHVVVNQFSLIRPKIIIKEIHCCTTPRETGSVPQAIGTGTSFARDEEQYGGHNSNGDIFEKAVDHGFIISGGYSAEFCGWTAKTANIGTASRQVPYIFLIPMVEDEMQKPSDFLF